MKVTEFDEDGFLAKGYLLTHSPKRAEEAITIRFDPETLAQLRAQAREKGLGPTTLARM